MQQAELEKMHIDIEKLMAETRKLNVEAGMIRETFCYSLAIATGLITVVATITTLLMSLAYWTLWINSALRLRYFYGAKFVDHDDITPITSSIFFISGYVWAKRLVWQWFSI